MPLIRIPRIVIAGSSSGSGKTILSIGLMRAFKNRGLKVAPFKIGPDFIDPMYHLAAAKASSRNLDGFMMSEEFIQVSFAEGSINADIAVVEGVMGAFDSHDGLEERGSTAQVAKIIRSPVILVIDVRKTARSAAAIAKGFKEFDPALWVAGVVLNKIGSQRHADKASRAVESLAGLVVLGSIPRDQSLSLPERHLGLVPEHETRGDIEAVARSIEKYVDIERLVEIAKLAPEMKITGTLPKFKKIPDHRIGVVYDDAFRFYYAETLSQISSLGNLVYIDAIRDKSIPDIDALFIGGGFPEVFADKLEGNKGFRKSLRDYCEAGGKVYAECGGLMYLGEEIQTEDGVFEMVGFLPVSTVMQKRYAGMGYVENLALRDNLLCGKGELIVGHEFHHSRVELKERVEFAFKTRRGTGVDGSHDGILRENVLASYMHVHPLGYPRMVENVFSASTDVQKR